MEDRNGGRCAIKVRVPGRRDAVERIDDEATTEGLRRVLRALAATRADAYRFFADALGIKLEAVQVDLEAGIFDGGSRVSSLRSMVRLRGVSDIAGVERMRALVDRLSPASHPVLDHAGIASEVVVAS